MSSIANLTPQQLRNAADLQERILSLKNDLHRILGTSAERFSQRSTSRRRLSPQGLANIRAGARKRWGLPKGRAVYGKGQVRGKMSAAGRARIAAALKARWAAAKRAGRNAL